MLKVEIQVPKTLTLTRKQVNDLKRSFKKQLVETLRGKQATTKVSSKRVAVELWAK